MSKRFSTQPKSVPVTSSRPARAPRLPGASRKAKGKATAEPVENSQPEPNIPLAQSDAPVASLSSTTQTGPEPDNPAAGIPPAAKPATPARSMKHMDLKLTRSTSPRKSQRIVIYNIEGRTGSVQFLSTLFGGSQKDPGNPPETLTLSGEFAEPKPKVERAKETPEERKARLAAMPKPTLEEKVARAEKRAAELRAKLAAGGAAQQPSA